MRKILLIILSLIIFSCSSNDQRENGIVLTYYNSWPIYLNEFFKGPIKEKITYKDGLRHGEYISYFQPSPNGGIDNGLIKEKGSYKNDLKDGEFIFWRKTLSSRELEKKVAYKDGLRHGMTIIYTENGIKQEEITFKNDVRDGKYRKYFRDCLKEESFYSNGKKNGKSFVYPYPCYKDYEVYISNNNVSDYGHGYKHNIPEKTFGLIQVYTFKDGVEEGEFLSYFEKGVLESIGNYKNGKVHGYFIDYNTGNQLVKLKSDIIDSPRYKACEKIEHYRKVYGFTQKIRCDYSLTKKVREEIYSMIKEEIIKNPLIAGKSNWAYGLQHGPYTSYHLTDNNQQIISGRGNAVNGKTVGPYQSYYINGQLQYDGVFNEDGHLLYGKSFYKSGKLKEEFLEEDLEERIAAKQRKNSSSSSSSSSSRCPSGQTYFSKGDIYNLYSITYSGNIFITDWGHSWLVTISRGSRVIKTIPVPKCQ